jgi:SPP1 family phage portal protein
MNCAYTGEADDVLRNIHEKGLVFLQPDGDIRRVQTEPETSSTEALIKRLRQDIYSFGSGMDSLDEANNTASGAAFLQRRSHFDIECSRFESLVQNAFEEVAWFVLEYLFLTKKGDWRDESIKLTLNKDIVADEAQTIQNVKNSIGIIPMEQLIMMHPWANDRTLELWRKEQDEKVAFDEQIFVTDENNTS